MNRSWMYNKNLPERGGLTAEFLAGVNEFMRVATRSNVSGREIRCPCRICKNEKHHKPPTVRDHIYRKGFMPDYFCWTSHGERRVPSSPGLSSADNGTKQFTRREDYDKLNPQQRMIFDAAGPNFVPCWTENVMPNSDQGHNKDTPSSSTFNSGSSSDQPEMNANVDDDVGLSRKFWDMLNAAGKPLWDGCENETQLSAVTDLLKIKSEYNLSGNCYDKICQWAKRCMPQDNTLPADYYQTKKLVRELGLPMEKIDICPKGCMLYWKGDAMLRCCKFCKHERYKSNVGKKEVAYKQLRYLPLIPRLQRLFASPTTAAHMTWHATHKSQEGIMSHPSDSEAWKHFDKMHPEFANEPRNVRLSLCADGFAPFGQYGNSYSCWPVILTPYNLPPEMCLKTPYMFLSMVIPGPRNPKKLIDVCLQPLIEELILLWTHGMPTFDSSKNETFCMRASLLWTVHDFPAYGMIVGWSRAGLMGCPICMEDTKSFWLEHSKKPSWFDAHRRHLRYNHHDRKNKKAFFKDRVETSPPPHRFTSDEIWNRVKDLPSVIDDPHSNIDGYLTHHKWTKRSIFWELPYWKTLLIRHNLDVMHVEKNVFDNVFNTVMDIKDKSKDTLNARKDLKLYCDRPEIQVDADHQGTKPKAVYTLTKDQKKEVCNWIKSLKFPDGYASNIGRCVQLEESKLIGMKSHDCHVFMQRLIPIAFRELLPESVWEPLTELSQLFHSLCSPTLSVAEMQELDNVIPHLLCKLERIFPPSFFDSMEHLIVHLPFEAKIAGPVQYRWMYPFERFLHHLKKKISNKARVEASICSSYIIEEISTLIGHYSKPNISSNRMETEETDELSGQPTNILQDTIFNYPGRGIGKSTSRWLNDRSEKHAIETYVLINCEEVNKYLKIFCDEIGSANIESDFTPWFKSYVKNNNIQNELIRSLAAGPSAEVTMWPGYVINGYTFHNLQRGEGKTTMNSGVWVKGSSCEEDESDFYGLLEEIIQLEYTGITTKEIVLFKCRWFDPNSGVRVHKKYDLVEVNPKRVYKSNDVFILASQARQAYYAPYAGAKRDRANWWAVSKIKARSTIEQRWSDIQEAYQPDDAVRVPSINDLTTENLRDPNGEIITVEDELLTGDDVQDDDASLDDEDDFTEEENSEGENDD